MHHPLDQIQCHYHQHNICPDSYRNEIRDDYYALNVPCSRGGVRVVSNGQLLFDGELEPGMLRLIAPAERTEIEIRSKIRRIALLIPGPRLRSTLDRAGLKRPDSATSLRPLLDPDPNVVRLAAALLAAQQLAGTQRQTYIDGLTNSLLACLLSAQPKHEGSGQHTQSRALNDMEFTTCSNYADAKLEKKLGLTEWAAAVDLSPTEFTRRFRKRTNQAPYAWFLARRIERSKEFLLQQELTIPEVALRLGFCSQSHYTEAFRRRVGCSPARWKASQFRLNIDKQEI